jgi:guanylate kinase
MPPIFILSAPSGGGKTTIAKALLRQTPDLARVITTTTRKPRPEERDGRDYFFISAEEFKKQIAQNEFAEWANVHNHYYGTSHQALKIIFTQHKAPLLVIDVQGAKSIKQQYSNTILIFIIPENFSALRKWLIRRGRNNKEEIVTRLRNAKEELAQAKYYDYTIVNRDGKLEETIQKVVAIIQQHIKKSTY